jgi:hypothetical protein
LTSCPAKVFKEYSSYFSDLTKSLMPDINIDETDEEDVTESNHKK